MSRWESARETLCLVRSVSLQGFGIDSVIELIAGGILLWRLLIEQRGGTTDAIEQAERRAAWVTALSLFALAIYIVVDSAFALITQSRPEASWISPNTFRTFHSVC